jgi:predicted transcriptional regulator
MKIKLGIIGPKDSLDKICKVAEEFTDKVRIYRFVYESKDETLSLIEACQKVVDVVLFSGHIPYYIAKYGNAIYKPTFYVPRVGTSILKVLFEIHKKDMNYSKISIDSIQEVALKEVAEEMDIKFDEFYVIPYEENIEYEELAGRHIKLWEEGKIKIAITGLTKTYEKIKAAGIPAFKLIPTTFLIREYLTKAIYAADAIKSREKQLSVQIVKIKNDNKYSHYQFMEMKNDFERFLIKYTKSVYGSIFPSGRDEYMIFSSRGIINSYKSDGFKNFLETSENKNIVFASGIGYGTTVYNAECNAKIALDFAMTSDGTCLYIVDEFGKIKGPIVDDSSYTLEYNLAETDKNIQQLAEEINISPAYVSKLMAVINRTNSYIFDANDLSTHLDISTRSARRILTALVNSGYAEVIAKESNAKTGRPRNKYRIDFKDKV